jgi:hypothetical protein
VSDPSPAAADPAPSGCGPQAARLSWRETLVALAAAIVAVVAVGAVTNRLEPTGYFYD